MPKLSWAQWMAHLAAAAEIMGSPTSACSQHLLGLVLLKEMSDEAEQHEESGVVPPSLAGVLSEEQVDKLAAVLEPLANVVPSEARWSELVGFADQGVGARLNLALRALEVANPARLAGMTGEIDFTIPVDGAAVPDDTWRRLLAHFSTYRLATDDVEFPDLVAATYEILYLPPMDG